MKKFYEDPELEFVTFRSEDIIVTSGQCAGSFADEADTCEGFDDDDEVVAGF